MSAVKPMTMEARRVVPNATRTRYSAPAFRPTPHVVKAHRLVQCMLEPQEACKAVQLLAGGRKGGQVGGWEAEGCHAPGRLLRTRCRRLQPQ
jgi:hypothetical protein